MALRRFASEAVKGLGLQTSPCTIGTSSSSMTTLRALAARGFATVVDGLKYAKSHEYVKMDGDVATVGISDFAQSELGDVVYVELPEVGSEVKQGETFGVVESVKAASDVYSPVTGEVLEVNDALTDEPAKVNSSPFDDGWMMKVKVSEQNQLDALMDASTYEKHCEEGGH